MRLPFYQLVWGERPVVQLPDCIRPLRIPAPPEHPQGWKGGCLLDIYRECHDWAPGAVVIDGDTAIDPRHVVALADAVRAEPGSVWTVACRIWGLASDTRITLRLEEGVARDASRLTGAPDDPDGRSVAERPPGVLAHRVLVGERTRWGRADDSRVDLFGLGCTYLPMALLERVDRTDRWDELVFPVDDLVLSLIAREVPPIPVRLVPGVEAVHVHWTAHDVTRYLAWREDEATWQSPKAS